MKRWIPAIVSLGACGGVPTGAACSQDSDCGGGVCANTEECAAAGDVQAVKVAWTVNGAPADATDCAPSPFLTIAVVDHTDGSDNFGGSVAWGPVACTEGGYSFDKLPTEYDIIELMGNNGGAGGEGTVPAGGGDVAIDLGYPQP